MSLQKDLLTTQDVARWLGVSPSSVQKMVGRGELQAWVTPGGHRRIYRDSVMRLMAQESGAPKRPDSLAAPVQSTPHRPAACTAEPLRVLLAEDDATQVSWFRQVLGAHGAAFELTVAADASQALIQLERQRPDVVVTDLVMQPFDGFHLVRTIMAETAWDAMDVLVLSALTDDDIAARGGLPAGVCRLPKSVSLERLWGWLDAQVARRRAPAPATAPGAQP